MDKPASTSSTVTGRITFRNALARISTLSIVITMTVSWMLITTASLISFKQYSEKNLQLLTSTLSQSIEAAVVFRDGVAARETLSTLGQQGQFSQAIVTDANGRKITFWQAAGSEHADPMSRMIAKWLFPSSVLQPIYHRGNLVGHIEISGSDAPVKSFVYFSLLVLTLCLVFASILSVIITRHLHHGLIMALQNIAEVVHDIRENRNFARRVPSAKIVELDVFSQDFNSLLEEIESWQEQILKENDSLLKRSLHDALTGLANRTAFCSALENVLEDEESHSRTAVLFMDGNQFKYINDTYGHAAGDKVLITIAKRLKYCAGKKDLPARLGGDEFALILSDVQDMDDVMPIVNKIRRRVSQPIELQNGAEVVMSLSIGVAIADQYSTIEDLLEQADKNMYLEKQKYRRHALTR
ncbi:diguanylate cyclase DgcN [Lonsdalea quercina]|uniref:diguanylate cyclase DgcN n=1 Tax=Lonsdalea quercina TaxID=71657 RepID=UPI0004795F48|nr:diguanylate cyclase DgcN [Lonsdalea quercina]